MSLIERVAIARVCHEANRAYCQSLGDFSQASWDIASGWQRESAISGVKFLQENPEAPAGLVHDQWVLEKREHGWLYGEVKDEAEKTHPCLVPFIELPPEQQAKDKLFKVIVHALS